jgi:hypothetical protein
LERCNLRVESEKIYSEDKAGVGKEFLEDPEK